MEIRQRIIKAVREKADMLGAIERVELNRYTFTFTNGVSVTLTNDGLAVNSSAGLFYVPYSIVGDISRGTTSVSFFTEDLRILCRIEFF